MSFVLLWGNSIFVIRSFFLVKGIFTMYKTLYLLLILILLPQAWLEAQCNSDSSDARCIESISQNNTFVKSYKLEHQKQTDKEFSSVLAKDTQYILNLCEDGQISNNVIINVYNTKRKLIASNKTSSSILNELSFRCDKTGVYYFEFKANQAASDCGIGALSFRRLSSK